MNGSVLIYIKIKFYIMSLFFDRHSSFFGELQYLTCMLSEIVLFASHCPIFHYSDAHPKTAKLDNSVMCFVKHRLDTAMLYAYTMYLLAALFVL